jgi:hypothetical protein
MTNPWADITNARLYELQEAMTVAEAKVEIERLTAVICDERIQGAIGKLHSEIITKASRSAHELLGALAEASSELEQNICQQDFMNLNCYENLAREIGDYVPEALSTE